MSAAAEKAQGLGITNSALLAGAYARAHPGRPSIYISYRPIQSGRAYQCAAYQVISPLFKTDTDPNKYWRDYGNQTFQIITMTRAEAKQAAMDWAAENYGVTEWAPASLIASRGDLFPAEMVRWLKARLKAMPR